MPCTSERLKKRLDEARRLWIFLDYDGTLADFAPTPEHVNPNPEVVQGVSQMPENHAIVNVGVWHGFTFLSGLVNNGQKRGNINANLNSAGCFSRVDRVSPRR